MTCWNKCNRQTGKQLQRYPIKFHHTIFLFLSITAGIAGSPVTRSVTQIAENLSGQHAQENSKALKPRLAVSEFKVEGNSLQGKNYPRLLADEFTSAFSRSSFVLVERADLAALFKEMELEQTGLVEAENREQFLEAADYLLYGTLLESGETATLTVKLTDAATGKQYSASDSMSLSDLAKGRESYLDKQYQLGNAAAVSIFTETTLSGENPSALPIPAIDQTGISILPGIELRYRFYPWLALSAGFSRVYGHAQYFETMTADASLGTPQTGEFVVIIDGSSYVFNSYFSMAVNRHVHLFLMPGLEYSMLSVNGYFNPSRGNGFGTNEVGPILYTENFGFRIFAGTEVFATPRLSFSFKAGYTYLPISVSTGAIQHLNNLPDPLESDLGGFTWSPAVTVYF